MPLDLANLHPEIYELLRFLAADGDAADLVEVGRDGEDCSIVRVDNSKYHHLLEWWTYCEVNHLVRYCDFQGQQVTDLGLTALKLHEQRTAPTVAAELTTRRKKTGRPKKTEKDADTKVIAALAAWHGYQEGGSVTNSEPAPCRGLAEKYGLSTAALSRFLARTFSGEGHRKYTTACQAGKIGFFLASWQQEDLSRLAGLRSHESGRTDDD